MYDCESWIMKKTECQIDAFELWCWWRLLRVPWTTRRSTQSILKEIHPVYSKGDQSWVFFGRNDAKAETAILRPPDEKSWLTEKDSSEKTLMLRGIGGRRRRGWDGWMASQTQWMSLSELQSWWWTGRPGVLRFMGSQRVGHKWATELNWTEYLFLAGEKRWKKFLNKHRGMLTHHLK